MIKESFSSVSIKFKKFIFSKTYHFCDLSKDLFEMVEEIKFPVEFLFTTYRFRIYTNEETNILIDGSPRDGWKIEVDGEEYEG